MSALTPDPGCRDCRGTGTVVHLARSGWASDPETTDEPCECCWRMCEACPDAAEVRDDATGLYWCHRHRAQQMHAEWLRTTTPCEACAGGGYLPNGEHCKPCDGGGRLTPEQWRAQWDAAVEREAARFAG